jgi:hypothetical protein
VPICTFGRSGIKIADVAVARTIGPQRNIPRSIACEPRSDRIPWPESSREKRHDSAPRGFAEYEATNCMRK